MTAKIIDFGRPVKILKVRAIKKGILPDSSNMPVWYDKWCSSNPVDCAANYNATVSQWYDRYSNWLGVELRFYDLEGYTEFCLRWM